MRASGRSEAREAPDGRASTGAATGGRSSGRTRTASAAAAPRTRARTRQPARRTEEDAPRAASSGTAGRGPASRSARTRSTCSALSTGRRGRAAGTGRRGAIRDTTRDDYRRHIERYWLPALGARPLGEAHRPRNSRELARARRARRDGVLADRTHPPHVRAVSARCSLPPVEEGLIALNPARDVAAPVRAGRAPAVRQDADDGDDPAPGQGARVDPRSAGGVPAGGRSALAAVLRVARARRDCACQRGARAALAGPATRRRRGPWSGCGGRT